MYVHMQGACTKLQERAARAEAALAAAQAAHEQTQGALSAEAAARTEAEAQARESLVHWSARPRMSLGPQVGAVNGQETLWHHGTEVSTLQLGLPFRLTEYVHGLL